MKLKIKMLIVTMAVTLIIASIVMYNISKGAKMDGELIAFFMLLQALWG